MRTHSNISRIRSDRSRSLERGLQEPDEKKLTAKQVDDSNAPSTTRDLFLSGQTSPLPSFVLPRGGAPGLTPGLASELGMSSSSKTNGPKRGLAAADAVASLEANATTTTNAEQIVSDVYRDLLLREPDAEGLKTHVDLANAAFRDGDGPAGVRQHIEEQIKKSDEFKTIDAVQQSFQSALGRTPTEKGYWHNEALKMRSEGKSHDEIRATLEGAHRQSDEYRLNHPEEMVGDVYRDLLMRDPDSEGLRTWTDKAEQLREQGKSAAQIDETLRREIGGSDEAQVIERVNKSFENVLGRTPTEKGVWHEEALKMRAQGMSHDEIQAKIEDAHRQSAEYRASHPEPVAPPPSMSSGPVSSDAVMNSAASVAQNINATGGYLFDGHNDCYGFVQRALNPLLTEQGLPKLPVNDYGTAQATRDWPAVTDWSQVPVGTPLSTHAGHMWGDAWHGGIFAGVQNGVPMMWDSSSGTGGAYFRPVITSGPYALDHFHAPTADAIG